MEYKSIRIIDGKPRLVIVDEDGKIINRNPSKDELIPIVNTEEARRKPLFPFGTKCCVHGEIIIGKGFKYPNKKNWDGHSFACNTCYQRRYRLDNPDIIKLHNNELHKTSSWENGELDPYSEKGRGYIIEQFVCKPLGVKNLNVESNTSCAKYDTTKHDIFGNIQIKGSTFNGHYYMTNIRMEEEFDTLIFVCTDRYIPWKNVRKMYAIPSIELIGETNIYIYEDWSKLRYSSGCQRISKFERLEKYRIDEKHFNESYQNLTIGDCPALRKDKFIEWIKIMKEGI